jgi:hypothetical protein
MFNKMFNPSAANTNGNNTYNRNAISNRNTMNNRNAINKNSLNKVAIYNVKNRVVSNVCGITEADFEDDKDTSDWKVVTLYNGNHLDVISRDVAKYMIPPKELWADLGEKGVGGFNFQVFSEPLVLNEPHVYSTLSNAVAQAPMPGSQIGENMNFRRPFSGNRVCQKVEPIRRVSPEAYAMLEALLASSMDAVNIIDAWRAFILAEQSAQKAAVGHGRF